MDDFLRAVNSDRRGLLDEWLECHNEAEVRDFIRKAIGSQNSRRFEAAKAAMTGLVAEGWRADDNTAEQSVRLADALLAELDKNQ